MIEPRSETSPPSTQRIASVADLPTVEPTREVSSPRATSAEKRPRSSSVEPLESWAAGSEHTVRQMEESASRLDLRIVRLHDIGGQIAA